MNFWAPKPKCHYPSTHSGFKDAENRLPSCHSGCYGAVGKQPNPDRQWQQWPLCPTLPCLFLSSLILLCSVTCASASFFPAILSCQIPPCRVICPITVGETFVADMSSEITFMPRNMSAFLSSLRKELSRDTSPWCITDYPCKTGACLIPLHPLGDCWRPSTVPLAPGLLSNDVIGGE